MVTWPTFEARVRRGARQGLRSAAMDSRGRPAYPFSPRELPAMIAKQVLIPPAGDGRLVVH